MRDIIENVIIVYKGGFKRIFDAISITENGIFTGYLKSKHTSGEEFINQMFIPRDRIQKIMITNPKHNVKNIEFKKIK